MPRYRALLAAGMLVAGCGSTTSTGALHVTVDFEAEVTSPCVRVWVLVDGEEPRATRPMLRGGKQTLEIAIFRDALPSTVTLEAEGSSDEGCTTPTFPPERSARVPATFSSGVTTVGLTVLRGAPIDDGGTASRDGGPDDAGVHDAGTEVDAGLADAGSQLDAGLPDAGAGIDAGLPDAGAGLDAGLPDAGRPDAGGMDAGLPDAGPPDAGVEACRNRLDDDGDGLIDCADPDCGNGVVCDDGDACTTGDVCMGQVCTAQLRSCVGQLPVCMMPTGCDAGVCLAGPAPARQPCDGGRCDGVGRCAPFCDPTRTGLRACYRFEGSLTDGSANGNDATGTSSFDAGARGRAWFAGANGLVVGDHSSLDCTNALTMEAWLYLSAFPAAAGRFGIFDNDGQYGMFVGPGGELRCSAGVAVNVPGSLTLHTWQHVACVLGNGTLKAYRNGTEIGTANTAAILMTGNGNGLTLGQNSPSGDVLVGALDGVRLWCEVIAPLDLCATPGECG